MGKSKGFLAGIVLLVFSVAVAVVGYKSIHFWLTPANSRGGQPRIVFYEVQPNSSPLGIAAELARQGVVANARLFYWYSRLTGQTKKYKAGDYRFTNQMRPDEVLAVLTSGKSYGVPLAIPEGYNMYQVAEILERQRPGSGARFLKLCQDRALIESLGFLPVPASLEGYLFPDTYMITRKTSEEELIRSMVRKYRSTVTTEMRERTQALGMTEHQIVTLASIIEKETGAPEERPLISSVFHNRLKKKMRLQSDPTVIYGLKDYKGNITRAHLTTNTPYNTYTIPALPIGPIANPGKEAIVAALYPAESEYLYFVSHNDGTHEFTTNYEAHREAVAKYQLDAKARAGKSWRDLSKKNAPNNGEPRAEH